MSVSYCSVDGCDSKMGGGLSFYRCPKDEARSQSWKTALGFTGNHRYANITADQCYSRIKVCSLHFTDECFRSEKKKHIKYGAIPSLMLPTPEDNMPCSSFALNKIRNHVSVQTDDVQNVGDNIIYKHESTQTSSALSWGTPRKTYLRKKIKRLEKAAITDSGCKKMLETNITIEDVKKFLEKNYSEEACKLLQTQLSLLGKAPRGCRYSDEFKQFALSIYFLGPKAYKKMSTRFRLPSKATLQRFTRKWAINPGFNDFIFSLTKLRVQHMKEKEKDCILVLDEISIKSHLFYDISKDKIIGFQESLNKNSTEIASSALVVMARGIASNWKQPLAYFFYNSTAPSDEVKDILFESVRRLNSIGLNVLAVVSDQGPNFVKLVKNCLKLDEDNLFFFVDNIKLFYLFDVPHLVKSTRNNFFSHVFKLKDGETNKSYLETMYNYDKVKEYRCRDLEMLR